MFCISGEFADVYKGILKTREGKKIVAIKVLRVSFFTFAALYLCKCFVAKLKAELLNSQTTKMQEIIPVLKTRPVRIYVMNNIG